MYALEDLSSEQFEDLIVFLCMELLGPSTQGFSPGPDGGRDARFVGTAQIYPSSASRWEGTVIVQAKHASGYNRSCSEPDFYSEDGDSSIIAGELPRITRLRQSGELDHYLLFTNRRLSAGADMKIRTRICRDANLPTTSVRLCGSEGLARYLKRFPNVVVLADIDPVDSPLKVSPEDLAIVVEALADNSELVTGTLSAPVPRTPYELKNELNNMSAEYAKAQRRRYLADTKEIDNFLQAPASSEYLVLYQSVVDEFQLKITARRRAFQSFDNVMEYLADLLFSRDPVLRSNKRLTRAVLFYMYWCCDIGAPDA